MQANLLALRLIYRRFACAYLHGARLQVVSVPPRNRPGRFGSLFGRHAQRAVDTDRLAVDVAVLDDVDRERGGIADARRGRVDPQPMRASSRAVGSVIATTASFKAE